MKVYNKQVATALVLNANRTTDAIPLKFMFMFSIAAIFTGAPVGTIKLQASNDPETNDTVPLVPPMHWADIEDSEFVLAPTDTEVFWNYKYSAFNYVRVVFTDGSGGAGTATTTIIFNGKG